MAIKKELIQFTISNETDCSINLPLFQQNVYSINATTKYSWDITSEVLACGTGTIVVNENTLTLNFTPTLTGLLNALNALGFGFFCTESSGGSTFLYVVDDTNVYGGLDLCPSGTTTTTTTSTTTAAPATTTTTTSTTTAAPTTTTTTSTTTAAPTTTTTTSTTTAITNVGVGIEAQNQSGTASNFIASISTDGGATWSDITNCIGANPPNYNFIGNWIVQTGSNVLLAVTDSLGNDISFGIGFNSGDYVSLCGKSNPYVANNVQAPFNLSVNLAVSGGSYVPCTATTTTTTTSTTTAPATSTTTTTSTTTAPATSTTTTTSTTTAPATSTTTTTSTTTAPETTTTTTTSTTTVLYNNYIADRYDCATCSLVASGVIVALPQSVTPTFNDFYVPSAGSGEQGIYTYQVLSSTLSGPGLILDNSHAATCSLACSIIP